MVGTILVYVLFIAELSFNPLMPVVAKTAQQFGEFQAKAWLGKCFKVEPYSIHGSFLKLEYLKTEFNEDSGTYAVVKVTSHSYRIMVN